MTVDMTELKVGDTVKFRCGGEDKVIGVYKHETHCILTFEKGRTETSCYHYDGVMWKNVKSLLDIVEIIQAYEEENEVDKFFKSVSAGDENQAKEWTHKELKGLTNAIKADIFKEIEVLTNAIKVDVLKEVKGLESDKKARGRKKK